MEKMVRIQFLKFFSSEINNVIVFSSSSIIIVLLILIDGKNFVCYWTFEILKF